MAKAIAGGEFCAYASKSRCGRSDKQKIKLKICMSDNNNTKETPKKWYQRDIFGSKTNKGEIKETKCTCSACGHTWYYGKQEALQNAGAAMQNVGKQMACCGGCLPAAFIPTQKVVDFNKCPKCNSQAVKKEVVTHNV